ncbi:hypothetical protein LCGC14_0601340 [marine sediment metagenome]|uniref:Uncharacterized protein n=2 Tax=root TaxID=1 RepID=A0A831R1C6_9GAMM|nr:hypothetical protein [Marinobacter antarcticus]HEA50772.1 hypothetical protein [Marinobacter antarcticus]
MLHSVIDHLSVWEVAHRWHGYDPNSTDPQALPLIVQDSLRTITRLQFSHELFVCSPQGVVRKSLKSLPSFDDFIVPELMDSEVETGQITDGCTTQRLQSTESANGLSEDERQERYEDFSANWTRRHDEAVKDFPLCFDQRVFRKADLEKVHVLRSDVLHLCEIGGAPLASFWFSEMEQQDHQRYLETGNSGDSVRNRAARMKRDDIDAFWSRLDSKQKHRLLCREIAAQLWLASPDRTIADLIRDPSIKNIGGGKYYDGDKTVREWIKDLDPRPKEMKKGGRPARQ